MSKIYPAFTSSSFAISGYKSAKYQDLLENLILFTEKKNVVVFDTATNKKIRINTNFIVSSACFINLTKILIASGNLLRVYEIESRSLLETITVNGKITAINSFNNGFAVATTSQCYVFDSNYVSVRDVVLPAYSNSIITYGKLVLFTAESALVYNLNNLSVVTLPHLFESITDLFEYNLNQIIVNSQGLQLYDLSSGLSTPLLIGSNTKLFADVSASSRSAIIKYDSNVAEYKDIYMFINSTGDDDFVANLEVEVSDGRIFYLNESNDLYLSVTGEGTITINGEISPVTSENYIATLSISGDTVVEVIDYGTIPNLSSIYFFDAPNLEKVPASISPYFTTFFWMFYKCSKLNDPNIILWDISNIIDMRGMFRGASSFNQNIGSWDVSNVKEMSYVWRNGQDPTLEYVGFDDMFKGATSFNQNLTCWKVEHITIEPNDFATNSALAIGNTPLWGQSNTDMTGRTGASCNS